MPKLGLYINYLLRPAWVRTYLSHQITYETLRVCINLSALTIIGRFIPNEYLKEFKRSTRSARSKLEDLESTKEHEEQSDSRRLRGQKSEELGSVRICYKQQALIKAYFSGETRETQQQQP